MKQGVHVYRRDFLEENPAMCIQSLKNLHMFHLVISFLRICPKEIIKVLQWSKRINIFINLACSVVSNSLWPHGLWPTRLLCPWDFPSNSTGVGCHFLLHTLVFLPGRFCTWRSLVGCSPWGRRESEMPVRARELFRPLTWYLYVCLYQRGFFLF